MHFQIRCRGCRRSGYDGVQKCRNEDVDVKEHCPEGEALISFEMDLRINNSNGRVQVSGVGFQKKNASRQIKGVHNLYWIKKALIAHDVR